MSYQNLTPQITGSNSSFSIAPAKYVAGSTMLILTGDVQRPGIDYFENADGITITTPYTPLLTDELGLFYTAVTAPSPIPTPPAPFYPTPPGPGPKPLPIGALPVIPPDELLQQIMAYEFGLDEFHCLLGNQEYEIPSDQKLFVAIFDNMGPPYGQCTFLDTDETSPTYGLEVQQSTILHTLIIALMAYITDDGYDDAKAQAPRVAGALQGFFAQQLMGEAQIQFGRAQAPVNATGAEGVARLVRYDTRLNATVLHQVVKPPPPGADYFDKYNGATVDGTILPPTMTLQQ